MLTVLQQGTLVVRFLLELTLLGAVAAAAWHATGPGLLRWCAVVLAPVAVAAGWVLVVHGDAVPTPVRAAGQLAALALGIACLISTGVPRAAALLGAAALVNAALMAAWGQ